MNCNVCLENKPITEFYSNGVRPERRCKVCKIKKSIERQQLHRGAIRCHHSGCEKLVLNKWNLCVDHRKHIVQKRCTVCRELFTPNNREMVRCADCRKNKRRGVDIL